MMIDNTEVPQDIAERRRRKYKTEYNRTVQYLRVTVGLLIAAIIFIVWTFAKR
jgi:hypothetical protein